MPDRQLVLVRHRNIQLTHRGGGDFHDLTLVFGNANRQHIHCPLQILLLENVSDTHLVDALAGGLVEGCAGGEHNGVPLMVEVFQQPVLELVRVIHRQARHDVERASLVKGHGSLSVGNIIGANLFNLVLVSGVSVTLAPFEVPVGKTIFGINSSLILDMPLMLVVMALLTIPALTTKKLHRWQGILLLCIYAAFCAIQFGL